MYIATIDEPDKASKVGLRMVLTHEHFVSSRIKSARSIGEISYVRKVKKPLSSLSQKFI